MHGAIPKACCNRRAGIIERFDTFGDGHLRARPNGLDLSIINENDNIADWLGFRIHISRTTHKRE
jgi:hypothetical protein